METCEVAEPQGRGRAWAAVTLAVISAALGLLDWAKSPEGPYASPPMREEGIAPPAVVTFKPQSAAQLARVLDIAWDGVEGSGEVPGIAPSVMPVDMGLLDGETRKRTFLRAVAPHLLEVNRRIADDRRALLDLSERLAAGTAPSDNDLAFLRDACARYRVESRDGAAEEEDVSAILRRLLERVDEVPLGMALAQAAVESGWGSSRLAREDNGLFGQCRNEANKDGGARRSPNGAWYMRFRNIREGVEAYVRNLNTYFAYEDFRRMRGEMRRKGVPLDAAQLARGLLPYSELKDWYVQKIREVIQSRELVAFSGVRLRAADTDILADAWRREGMTLALSHPDGPPDA